MSGDSRVAADADEIETFANNLDQYLDSLIDLNSNIKSQLSRLGDSWQDQQFARFQDEFDRLMVAIDNFVEVASDQPPRLRIKAEQLRVYLSR